MAPCSRILDLVQKSALPSAAKRSYESASKFCRKYHFEILVTGSVFGSFHDNMTPTTSETTLHLALQTGNDGVGVSSNSGISQTAQVSPLADLFSLKNGTVLGELWQRAF